MLRRLLVIASNDFRELLRSPLGWCTLALYQLMLGSVFLLMVWQYMRTQPMLVSAELSSGITALVVARMCKPAFLLMLLMTPVLSMGSFAGERRQGSFSLLMSSPLSMTTLVLGKYLGLLGFLLVLVCLTSLMLVSLRLGGHLDLHLLMACILALCLVAASFAAIGIYISSLCRSPASAALGCLAALVVLWNLDAGLASSDTAMAGALGHLSLSRHSYALTRGVFSTADLAYFALLVVTFLALALRRLDAQRTVD